MKIPPVARGANVRLPALLLALLASLTLVSAITAQQAPPSLFTDAPANGTRAARLEANPEDPLEVLRSRPAGFSAEAWRSALGAFPAGAAIQRAASASPVLSLNLFADTSLAMFVDSVAPTADGVGHTVQGRVGQTNDGTAIITVYQGAVSASVRLTNGEFYEIFVPASGIGEIRQVRFHGLRGPASDAILPDEQAIQQPGRSAKASLDSPIRGAGPDNVVDVLVAYTERARQARGDSAGMLAHVNQVIAESNAAMVDSAVNMQFRLAHAVEVSWDDSQATLSYSSALNALRSSSDGSIDQVHALRDQYGADMVSLWISPPLPSSGNFTVGMAFMLSSSPGNFAQFAFSVVHHNYAGGSSATFAHEAGHNFGLAHDPDNGGASGGLFPDSRGYQQTSLNPKFFTIMAYSTGCTGCQPLIQFSNPAVNYQAVPTGVANANDAAKALNHVAPFAAAWRASTTPACSYTVTPASVGAPAGGGSYAVNVSTSAGCSWAPASNAGWIAVSDTSTRSASASFSFSVAANAASTSRNGSIAVAGRTVAVSQAASPALPNLSVSSSAVSLVAASGSSTPVSTTVAVSAGGASVPIAVSGNLPAWLTVGPASLQTPASLSIGANPAGLGAGTYAATVTLSSTATQNPSVSVAVAFTVRAPGKVLSSLRALSFHSDSTTVPPSQTLFVRDVAGVSNLTVSPGNTAWLSASQTLVSGTWQIVVRADPRGLADGIHDASLLLSCGALACDPGTIPVRLAVRNTAAGGPRIGSGGVVNAASFQQGMASGAWMSVFGANLASTSRSWRTSDFQGNRMPLALDGVQVFVGGQQAAIHFISPGQVNFQAPSGIPSGWVQVQISTPSGTDTAFVYASREAPGFFTFDSAGNLSALHSDGTPVGSATGGTAFPGRPAKPGEVLAIYGTGFGPTAPDVPSGRVFSGSAVLVSSNHLTVTIGGLPAEVRYAGLTGAGLNQINVVVPSLPRSTYEIVATAAGSPTQFSGRLIIE